MSTMPHSPSPLAKAAKEPKIATREMPKRAAKRTELLSPVELGEPPKNAKRESRWSYAKFSTEPPLENA